jgi:hypothetical protein
LYGILDALSIGDDFSLQYIIPKRVNATTLDPDKRAKQTSQIYISKCENTNIAAALGAGFICLER